MRSPSFLAVYELANTDHNIDQVVFFLRNREKETMVEAEKEAAENLGGEVEMVFFCALDYLDGNDNGVHETPYTG